MEEGVKHYVLLVFGIFEFFPIAFVFIVGLFISLSYRKDHPQVSLLAGISFFLLSLIFFTWNTPYLWILTNEIVKPTYLGTINFVISLLETGLYILVVIAIFGWRKTDETPQDSVR